MQALVVNIENANTKQSDQAKFGRSPVRLGRNQLNDLVVNESFVSQWHGIIRFDGERAVYVDLGSTNGTAINGQRIHKNVEISLDETSDLRIGPVRLTFSRAELEKKQGTGAYGRHTVGAGGEPEGFQRTLFMTVGQVQEQVQARQAGRQPPPPPSAAEMQQLLQAAEQLKAYNDAYRKSCESMVQAVKHSLLQVSAANRTSFISEVIRRYPDIAREPALKKVLRTNGVEHSCLDEIDPAEWITRLTTGDGKVPPIPGDQNTSAAMERVGAVLEVFGESFVELRKGYEQFGKDMAVNVVHEDTPLRRLDNRTQLLRYLLDWNADANERVQELKRFFGDLGLHQVAVLNGVTEGVRNMLSLVSPQHLSGAQPNAIIKKGVLSGIFPWKSAGHWFEYAKRHAAMMEEDRFTKEMFGRSFARAYYMITGSRVEEGLGTAQIRARTQTQRARQG